MPYAPMETTLKMYSRLGRQAWTTEGPILNRINSARPCFDEETKKIDGQMLVKPKCTLPVREVC